MTNPEFLHPATPNEFLPQLSNWTTMGGLVLIAIFGAALTLAGILKYKVTVKAPATIRPAGELRLVQAAAEGTIKSVAVQANQVVKKGDIIAYINDSRYQTQKSQLETNIQQATLQLVQIDAQVRAIEQQIGAETERNNRMIVSAKAEVNHSQRDLQDKQVTSISQVEEAEANLKQAQKELQKNQIHLKSLQANLQSSVAAFNAAKAKQNRYEPLAKVGSISIDQFQEAQLAVQQQEQQVKSLQAAQEEHLTAIKQQQQAVSAAAARKKAALAVLNPSNANVTIAQEKIAVETATGKANLSKLSQEREQLLQQKLETNKQLSRDQQELQQVIREISGAVIRASANGIIQELNLRNTSQFIRSGDVIAQIAPSDTPVIIKALVPSSDIRKVQKGQQVQMRVSSCSYTDYGTLFGRVSTISPDTIKLQNKDGSVGVEKSADYEVQIQPDSLVLTAKNKSCAIQPGMDGRVDIISSEETVLQFLLRKARLLTDL
ncbi:MAG: HlyD family efflux transporter periplasmic adaptor subunit [Stigonema ocellatum SAG 48.90 = DSM 106950]|nr:HlyD family efflux transporter periplasmic adaptor subunit [Stigonema ocellatum SAG 48.90 = DSM 106950]